MTRPTKRAKPTKDVYLPDGILHHILSFNDGSRVRHRYLLTRLLGQLKPYVEVTTMKREMFLNDQLECEGELWNTYVDLLGDTIDTRAFYIQCRNRRRRDIAEQVWGVMQAALRL